MNKYRNIKTVRDNITYDSKLEVIVAQELTFIHHTKSQLIILLLVKFYLTFDFKVSYYEYDVHEYIK